MMPTTASIGVGLYRIEKAEEYILVKAGCAPKCPGEISISVTIDFSPLHWLFDSFSELRWKHDGRHLEIAQSPLQSHITPT